ncbi:hypothetical protein K456DRAFT_1728929 [Colletotrichum gloeosporioides 23]|nr:hypothetical protein K456DRAFT_1728929 [Colletotrichum gloeosporioides 23]
MRVALEEFRILRIHTVRPHPSLLSRRYSSVYAPTATVTDTHMKETTSRRRGTFSPDGVGHEPATKMSKYST